MDLNGGTENRELKTNQTGVNLKHSFRTASASKRTPRTPRASRIPSGEGFDGADIGYGGTLGFDMGVRVVGDSSDHLPEMTTYGPNGYTSRYLDPTSSARTCWCAAPGEHRHDQAGAFQSTWERKT